MKIINQITELFVRIQPITRPPIAKCVTGRQRHLTSKKSIVFQSLLIVMSVSHEVPVLPFISGAFLSPVPVRIIIKQKSAGIVNERPTISCQQAVFQFQFIPFLRIRHPSLSLCITVHPIKSAICAFQIAFLLHSRLPGEGECPLYSFDYQIIVRKPPTVFFITHFHLGGGYFNPCPPCLQFVINLRI